MNLNDAPELPSLDPATAFQNYLNQSQGASPGGGGAGLTTANQITDPGNGGAIDVSDSGALGLTHVTSSEVRDLPDPTFLGQEIIVYLDQDLDAYGGSITIMADADVTSDGYGDTVFDAVGQCVIYYAVQVGGLLTWRVERAVNNVPTLDI